IVRLLDLGRFWTLVTFGPWLHGPQIASSKSILPDVECLWSFANPVISPIFASVAARGGRAGRFLV
ncbi:MAG: hypothetical protein AB7O86_09365, partial [Porticoccaceae bacterium]